MTAMATTGGTEPSYYYARQGTKVEWDIQCV